MSWIQKLCKTAENIDKMNLNESDKPWPVAHMAKKAHVEITLDNKGILRNIRILKYDEAVTLIPTTEDSASRTNTIAPHPLCEELSYCAQDLPGRDERRYSNMKKLMEGWLNSIYSHPKVRAVYTYLEHATVYADLAKNNIFPFKSVNYKDKKTPVKDEKVFIRWRIEEPDNLCSGTWQDASLIDSWISYDSSMHEKNGFCMLDGEPERIAKSHSRFLRASDDGAKLISSNDTEGFTFLGRFTDKKTDSGKQCCSIGYIASQKAHNTLRWLIGRQGYRKIDNEFGEAFVAWSVSCKNIPDPFANTLDFLGEQEELSSASHSIGDIGQSFALRLNKRIAGYKASISDTEDIVVMGLDSATPGRMAITFYRELTGSEFLSRIEQWHQNFAWYQNFGKKVQFVGVPAPKDIAWAAYCTKIGDKMADVDKKLLNATVERVLSCITDGAKFPEDLINLTVRRATNRNGLDPWEWEKCLGIACSLYKGINKERSYKMALEENRKTRDYLYGRLLAVADSLEKWALRESREERPTNAARLMQRFADRPCSTWRNIELALTPYKARLGKKIRKHDDAIAEIMSGFVADEYSSDSPLTGEFLLGYHCQRDALEPKKNQIQEVELNEPTHQ